MLADETSYDMMHSKWAAPNTICGCGGDVDTLTLMPASLPIPYDLHAEPTHGRALVSPLHCFAIREARTPVTSESAQAVLPRPA